MQSLSCIECHPWKLRSTALGHSAGSAKVRQIAQLPSPRFPPSSESITFKHSSDLGLFVTALNLLPIDGGHIVQALFSQRVGSIIGSISVWSLLLLALFLWPGLMLWAILVLFVGDVGSPPLNDLTPLTAGREWLGYVMLAILVLILMPLPHSL